MTLRLVALMSVVLLLSLAAFGLMMSHYQDRVMEEVARTASEVGRATLRTLETHGTGQGPARIGSSSVTALQTGWFSWSTDGPPPGPAARGEPEQQDVEVQLRKVDPHHIRVWQQETGGAIEPPADFEYQTETAAVAVVCESEGETISAEDCVSLSGEEALELENRFFIDVDTVRAEADPREGLVLRIETLRPETADDVATMVVDALDPGAGPAFVFKRHQDIRLPIPVAEYASMFDRLRRRSLWMFLGVFAVGSVLTAGLASRFTRPIRRLDSGIRELSSGNLDVQVPARGNDEIARLGRAFNEMTRSLRANRQRAREMLRREKHSALGRLAAGVAHDVRNPLHSIGLTLQHLGDTCRPEAEEKSEEFDRSLQIIRGEIRRLDQIVGNFLRFAKSEDHPRHEVALNDLVSETARLVRKEAEWRKIEVSTSLDASDPRIEGDGEALRSSILNLVINSFEAMSDGGKLRLSVECKDGHAVIEVADDGEGVPAEDQDRVFDFAYTTKEGGNGLGLAMVYQCIVEDHGGRVTLDSSEDGGTRVRMALPLEGGSREGVA